MAVVDTEPHHHPSNCSAYSNRTRASTTVYGKSDIALLAMDVVAVQVVLEVVAETVVSSFEYREGFGCYL